MKPRMMLVLVAGLLVAADAKDDAKKELEKLQGDWVMVSSERNGEALPDEQVKALRRTIKDDEFTVTRDNETVAKGKFTVDPSKSPKTIDVTITEGDNTDKTMKGIYEIDGDNYKVCFAPFSKDRPKEFSSKGDEGLVLSVWKKAKK
jgi:uncharacterized protein (TIGR03067 family)